MGGDIEPGNGRSIRRKVKSGCRTCKIRKVKCDEERPACRRCISTGRACDGYGIWGSGGNFYGQKQSNVASNNSVDTPWPLVSVSTLSEDATDTAHLEWFKYRVAPKLPGAFVSAFWGTLIFQASLTEPAVFHAVLTLSSVHKSDSSNITSRHEGPPDPQEQFMLKHYVKAIRHIQPQVSIKGKACIRVTLMTCLVFVCLEYLRGHFRSAESHLQSGLKVLRESYIFSNHDVHDRQNDEYFNLKPCHDPSDGGILEAFSRLYTQVKLFEDSSQRSSLKWEPTRLEAHVSRFCSVNEAWQQLERILKKIFRVNEQSRQEDVVDPPNIGCSSGVLLQAQHIRAELESWVDIYELSREDLRSRETEREMIACQMLFTYHAMAIVMIGTCLRPDDQSIFDSYTEQFVFIVNQSTELWRIRTTDGSQVRVLPGNCMNMARSIVDVGWIPPLYYTALKCRIHQVRVQAVKLLESTSHREGVWDAIITARVARKVMDLEEKAFYKDAGIVDNFQLSAPPSLTDSPLPSLPQSYRMHEIEVVLPDSPLGKVLLFCRQRRVNGNWTVLNNAYDISSQRWKD